MQVPSIAAEATAAGAKWRQLEQAADPLHCRAYPVYGLILAQIAEIDPKKRNRSPKSFGLVTYRPYPYIKVNQPIRDRRIGATPARPYSPTADGWINWITTEAIVRELNAALALRFARN
jgi:hypothetical protein